MGTQSVNTEVEQPCTGDCHKHTLARKRDRALSPSSSGEQLRRWGDTWEFYLSLNALDLAV